MPITYFIALAVWLFLTVLFANFATALAEARGKAQAESLRKARRDTIAYRLTADGTVEQVSSTDLKPGDRVVVQAGQMIPGDGEITEGIASVDESAITGESAPVIRAAHSDASGVTGGTYVLSDRIVVKITSGAGESFLDRMIALVEGAIRQRSPNEIALTLVLSAFTLIFLIVVVPLWPMAWNAEQYMGGYLGITDPLKSLGTDVPTLIALLRLSYSDNNRSAPCGDRNCRNGTGHCRRTSFLKAGKLLNWQAISMSCCLIRPARSHSGTGMQQNSSR